MSRSMLEEPSPYDFNHLVNAPFTIFNLISTPHTLLFQNFMQSFENSVHPDQLASDEDLHLSANPPVLEVWNLTKAISPLIYKVRCSKHSY